VTIRPVGPPLDSKAKRPAASAKDDQRDVVIQLDLFRQITEPLRNFLIDARPPQRDPRNAIDDRIIDRALSLPLSRLLPPAS
jgi:hypothetical protein